MRLKKKWKSTQIKQSQKLISFFLIFFLTLISFSKSYSLEYIRGKPEIIDGDTIKINNHKIRLYGIDAPEKKQTCKKKYLTFSIFNFQKSYECGKESTVMLKKKIKNKIINCKIKNKDRYNRFIGICFIDKIDINKWLVRNGHAVAYQKYSKRYVFDEQYASENRLGIWRGTFTRPEKWRRIQN